MPLASGATLALAGTDITKSSSGLLTATSIMTGFIFSMAVVFWNKSIDARRDPEWATRSAVLDEIDQMRNHLVYTVAVGVLTVACLVVQMLLGSATALPVWATHAVATLPALAGSLVMYLLSLVTVALTRFNRAALYLKSRP